MCLLRTKRERPLGEQARDNEKRRCKKGSWLGLREERAEQGMATFPLTKEQTVAKWELSNHPLGLPVVPFCAFLGEGVLTEIDYQKKKKNNSGTTGKPSPGRCATVNSYRSEQHGQFQVWDLWMANLGGNTCTLGNLKAFLLA